MFRFFIFVFVIAFIISIIQYEKAFTLDKKIKTDTVQQKTQIDLQKIILLINQMQRQCDSIESKNNQVINNLQRLSDKSNSLLQYLIPVFVAFLAGMLALLQVKGNNISLARITWIENLRGSISELIGEIEMLNQDFKIIKNLNKKEEKDKALSLFYEKIDKMKNLHIQLFRVKLYLNPDNPEHKNLDEKIDQFIKNALEDYKSLDNTEMLSSLNDQIIVTSRKILKEAWEDAKSTKIRELLKLRL